MARPTPAGGLRTWWAVWLGQSSLSWALRERRFPRDRRSLGGAEDRMGLRILDGNLGRLQGQIHLENSELKTIQTL